MSGDFKTFIKPIDVSVQDHETCIREICDYIDILPGVRQRNLTREEIRNIFFNTFPKIWQDSFKNTHEVQKCTLQEIKEWMTTTNMEADQESSKRKKQTNNNGSNKKQKKYGNKKQAPKYLVPMSVPYIEDIHGKIAS